MDFDKLLRENLTEFDSNKIDPNILYMDEEQIGLNGFMFWYSLENVESVADHSAQDSMTLKPGETS